jgi:hypothetical protein
MIDAPRGACLTAAARGSMGFMSYSSLREKR